MKERALNILITGTGGPTPRSFARSLRLGDYATYNLVGTDIHQYAIGLYQKEIFQKSYITPRSTEPGYWKVIEEIIEKNAIDQAVILPESEVRTWSLRQSENKLPCRSLIPDIDCVDVMLDKSHLNEVLSGSGLVPQSLSFGHKQSGLKSLVKSKLKYPFWVRSSTGSSGLGSLKIESFSDLERWLDLNPSVPKFIASEYLPGRNLACKLLYYEGNLIRAALAERIGYIMAKVAPSGITGNTSYGRLINDKSILEVAYQAMELVFLKTKARKHGFFTVDLKEDKAGRPYVTEINIRHVAFTGVLAMAGANLCEDTVRLLDNDSTFDKNFHHYLFSENYLFLREVDALPIIIKEQDLI